MPSASVASSRHGKATVVIRAQRVSVGRPSAPGDNRLDGRIIATSYLGGSAVYLIDAGGLRLQANNIIDDKVYREGDQVEIAFRSKGSLGNKGVAFSILMGPGGS